MKRWITFLFIFYAVLSAAVAQNKPTRFDVWGQVLDANTHGILSGVKVSLLSQDSVCIGTVTSFDNHQQQLPNRKCTGFGKLYTTP